MLLDQEQRVNIRKEDILDKSSESREKSVKHIDPHLHKNSYKYRIRNRKRQYYV